MGERIRLTIRVECMPNSDTIPHRYFRFAQWLLHESLALFRTVTEIDISHLIKVSLRITLRLG